MKAAEPKPQEPLGLPAGTRVFLGMGIILEWQVLCVRNATIAEPTVTSSIPMSDSTHPLSCQLKERLG